MYHIIGHKNPDTDAICSAIAAAEYFRLMGQDATPYRLGDLNKETEFVLKNIGVQAPECISEFPANSEVVLVDHNSISQSIDSIEQYQLKCIIDHHSIEKLCTSAPIQLRFEPICSTCSIIFLMFAEQELEMSDQIAKLILAGILSDSLAFRSPTTTEEDREIVQYLADDLGITDIQDYAKAMFDAKSDLGDMSVRKILELDYKVFTVGEKQFAYGVMETTSPEYAMKRKNEIIADMIALKQESQLDWIFFSVIDILAEKNITFVAGGDEENILKNVFNAHAKDGMVDLGNRLSRKKELEPALRQYITTTLS